MAAGSFPKTTRIACGALITPGGEPLPTSNLSVFAHFIGLWVTKSS